MESIVQAVLENALRIPDKIAIAAEDQELGYGELAEKIKLFANALKARGIKKGSRIAIEADELLSFFAAYLGCHLAGMVAVPIERNISIYRLQDILKTTKPVLVFMKNNGESFDEFFKGEAAEGKIKYPKAAAAASIISTTGTTGNPVLVTHTNKSLVAESQNLSEGIQLAQDSVLFTNISFDLAAGYRRVFAALRLGATAVITSRHLSEEMLWQCFDRFPISHISVVNANLDFFLHIENEKLKAAIGKLKSLETVSGSIDALQIRSFHRLYPEAVLYNVYGTTESGCLIYNNTHENPMENCLGRPAVNVTIEIVDENGQLVEQPGKYGYVMVKGSMNMAGYFHKKTLTEKVMPGDYIIMNDIVYFDEQGYYYFVSRVGDIIDVDGHKVLPTEIEKVASEYEGVTDCACAGEKSPHYGDMPVLYVVCDEETFDFDKFKNYLETHLEDYKVPGAIRSIDKIPRTATGKIMRKMLK